MNIVYIFLEIIKKNKMTYFLLSIQLTISMIALITALGMNIHLKKLEQISRSIPIDSSMYFYPNERYESALNKNEIAKKILDNPVVINDLARVLQANAYLTANDSYHNIYMYNSKFVESFKLPLSKGRWFDQRTLDGQVVQLIIGTQLAKQYSLGSKLEFYILDRNQDRISVQGVVVGILGKDDYLITASGNQLTSIIKKNEDVIIMPEIAKFNTHSFWEYGGFFISSDDEAIRDMKKLGYIVSTEQLIQEYKKGSKEQSFTILGIGLMAFLITLGGIGGLNALQVYYLERIFSIYYMLGARWRDCIFAVALKYIVLMIIPTIASLFAVKLLGETILVNMLKLNSLVFVSSFLIIIFILMVTSYGQLMELSRKNPVQIIRRGE